MVGITNYKDSTWIINSKLDATCHYITSFIFILKIEITHSLLTGSCKANTGGPTAVLFHFLICSSWNPSTSMWGCSQICILFQNSEIHFEVRILEDALFPRIIILKNCENYSNKVLYFDSLLKKLIYNILHRPFKLSLTRKLDPNFNLKEVKTSINIALIPMLEKLQLMPKGRPYIDLFLNRILCLDYEPRFE